LGIYDSEEVLKNGTEDEVQDEDLAK